jgi:hypothetical protein
MDVHRATDVGIVVPSEKKLALEEQASHPGHKDHVSTVEETNV